MLIAFQFRICYLLINRPKLKMHNNYDFICCFVQVFILSFNLREEID
jgi:hypothetical protein